MHVHQALMKFLLIYRYSYSTSPYFILFYFRAGLGPFLFFPFSFSFFFFFSPVGGPMARDYLFMYHTDTHAFISNLSTATLHLCAQAIRSRW